MKLWPFSGRKRLAVDLPGFLDDEHLRLIVVAMVVGLVAGFAAVVFHAGVRGLSALIWGGPSPAEGTHHVVVRALVPIIGLSAAGALLARFRASSDAVPAVMEMVAEGGGRIPPRTGIVHTLAACITLGCGGSAGREGPTVLMGSSLASAIAVRLGFGRATRQIMVGCGAAAAIGASFNAPIAAVVFAMEVLLGAGGTRTFTPLVVASVTGTIVGRAMEGAEPAFAVPDWSLVSVWELPTYVILGVLAGLVAREFVRTMERVSVRWASLPLPRAQTWILSGAVLGVCSLVVPGVLGNGYDVVESIFQGKVGLLMLLALLVVKPVVTAITLSGGGAGGVFAPSLFLGAALGALVGSAAGWLFPAWTAPSGAYALVGMAAVLAGATHAPIMAILFLFEMSGDYNIILPVMLSSVLASVVASRGGAESVYTSTLVKRGTRLRRGRQSQILQEQHAADLMRAPPLCALPTTGLDRVVRRILDDRQNYVYVSDEHGVLKGVVSLGDVRGYFRDPSQAAHSAAADLMVTDLAAVAQGSTLSDVAEHIDRLDLEQVPVVDDGHHLVGVVLRRDLLALINRTLLADTSLGIEFVQREGQDDAHRDYVQVPPGHRVEVVPVPVPWVGMSLRDLDIRCRFGVNVVAVRRVGPRGVVERLVPDPDLPLTKGELLVVTGADDGLGRMSREAHSGHGPVVDGDAEAPSTEP